MKYIFFHPENIIIFILLVFSNTINGLSQEVLIPRIKYIRETDRLPDREIGDFLNNPECIFEDTYGYIWIGTDKGLCRYDGYDLKIWQSDYADSTSLCSNRVISIVEDKEKKLWIATERGLSVYNRLQENFTNYFIQSEEGPYQLAIWGLFKDSRGLFWISTNSEELPLFDPVLCQKTQTFRTHSLASRYKFVCAYNKSKFLEDNESRIWVANAQEGIKCFNLSTSQVDSFKSGSGNPGNLSEGFVFTIDKDKEGKIWVSGGINGLSRLSDFEEKKFEHYNKENDDFILSNYGGILTSRDGGIWFFGDNGFSKYNYESKNFSSFLISGLTENLGLFNPMEDTDGNIWFCDYDGNGFFCFNPRTHNLVKFESSLFKSIYINDMYFSKSGAVWFLVEGEGVYKFNANHDQISHINLYSETTGLYNRVKVNSVCIDDSGKLWVGTKENGILYSDQKFDPAMEFNLNKFHNYRNNPDDKYSLPSNAINKIYKDREGNIWIGTDNGLSRAIVKNGKVHFRNKEVKFKSLELISSPFVYDILEDRSGNLWIATGWHLQQLDPETNEIIKNYRYDTIPQGIPTNRIKKLYEDRNNQLWATGSHSGYGFYQYIPTYDTFRIINNFINSDSGNSSIRVIDMYEDRHERFWIATDQGFFQFDPVNNLFSKQDFSSQHKNLQINSITEDNNGILWLPNNFGIGRYDPEDHSFQNLEQNMGFLNPYYLEKSVFRDNKGYIYAGGDEGLDIFHPDSIVFNQTAPPVYITDLQIYEESVFSLESTILDTALEDTRSLNLAFKDRFLTFTFTSLNFNNPSKNKYKYFMAGIDKDTIHSGSKRIAEYRDLKPGKYTFWVTGSNNTGVWNPKGVSMDIIIQPPWYRTILAYVIYAVLLILGIITFFRWRTFQLRNAKKNLENEVLQRTKVIREQNDEISVSMKKLEESRTKLENQKEELIATLENLRNTQNQLIQSEKMASLGSLVAGVAHEINTPVSVGLTAASSIIEETEKMALLYKENKISRTEFKEYLNTTHQFSKLILTNMERTSEMVQSFKQISVDQSTEQKRNFNLKGYTEDIIRSLYPKLKKYKVNISLDIEDNLQINSFPGVYSQIFTNLILNSLIHGTDEKNSIKINISCYPLNGDLIVEYSDSGKGIEKENLHRIFEPFFTTNKKFGTGLGLNIVYNLVSQKLRGTITCNSESGSGVTFKLKIPLND